MINHPAIDTVTNRMVMDVIGGAADTAKEVMLAMGQVAADSKASTLEGLFKDLDSAATAVLIVCPSLAPPINVLHMVMGTIEKDMDLGVSIIEAKKNLVITQSEFFEFMTSAMEKISDIGAELIKEGDTVFMYSMSSTIWRVLRRAKEKGKNFSVLVTESRPANEGLWTVDEMHKSGIPVKVSIDACLPELVAQSHIVFGGVDAVGADGSVLNKSGTYLSALVAREYGVPFYFVTDTLKFDTSTLLGIPFKSDPIHHNEVLGEKHYEWGVEVVGKVFDITPPKLISGIVTELGPIPPSACVNVMWKMKLSKRISQLLPLWASGNLHEEGR